MRPSLEEVRMAIMEAFESISSEVSVFDQLDPAVFGMAAETSTVQARRFVIINSRPLYSQCLITALRLADKANIFERYASVTEWRQSPTASSTSLLVVFLPESQIGENDIGVNDRNISQLRILDPQVPYVVMADRDDPEYILKALRAGARGFIPTSLLVEVTVQALHFVDSGGTFVPASSLLALAVSTASKSAAGTESSGPFSPRQLSVAKALRKGTPNKVIAYELNMCESTVKVHVRNIMKKLKAKNRTEVALMTSRLFPMDGE
jgi:DNA-binding NarL/FixJ family response regulator